MSKIEPTGIEPATSVVNVDCAGKGGRVLFVLQEPALCNDQRSNPQTRTRSADPALGADRVGLGTPRDADAWQAQSIIEHVFYSVFPPDQNA